MFILANRSLWSDDIGHTISCFEVSVEFELRPGGQHHHGNHSDHVMCSITMYSCRLYFLVSWPVVQCGVYVLINSVGKKWVRRTLCHQYRHVRVYVYSVILTWSLLISTCVCWIRLGMDSWLIHNKLFYCISWPLNSMWLAAVTITRVNNSRAIAVITFIVLYVHTSWTLFSMHTVGY